MSYFECERQQEVLEIARSGGWPDRCDEQLLAHIAACVTCGDLATAAAAIVEEHNSALAKVVVPSAGVMWWRIQRKARQETEIAARRAVTLVQGLSVAAGTIVAATLLPSLWKPGLSEFLLGASNLIPFTWTTLIVGGVALATVAPIAILAALRD